MTGWYTLGMTKPSSQSQVVHLGLVANGVYAEQLRFGIERFLAVGGENADYESYGGLIPLYGHNLTSEPTIRFDSGTLVIEFEAVRNSNALRPIEALNIEGDFDTRVSSPDLADGLAPGDDEFAPNADVEPSNQWLNVLVTNDDEEEYTGIADEDRRENPVLVFTEGGRERYVYLEVIQRTYEGAVYEYQHQFTLGDESDNGFLMSGYLPASHAWKASDLWPDDFVFELDGEQVTVTVKLRRDGDFHALKEDGLGVIQNVADGSPESLDHGLNPTPYLDDWEGFANFQEIRDIFFRTVPLDADGEPIIGDEAYWLDAFDRIGTIEGYAVYGMLHED